jgi:hypothetical protein
VHSYAASLAPGKTSYPSHAFKLRSILLSPGNGRASSGKITLKRTACVSRATGRRMAATKARFQRPLSTELWLDSVPLQQHRVVGVEREPVNGAEKGQPRAPRGKVAKRGEATERVTVGECIHDRERWLNRTDHRRCCLGSASTRGSQLGSGRRVVVFGGVVVRVDGVVSKGAMVGTIGGDLLVSGRSGTHRLHAPVGPRRNGKSRVPLDNPSSWVT